MRVTPAPDVHWTTTDRGGAVLNLRTGRWTWLDPVAAHWWQNLMDGHDTDDIAAATATNYDVPHARVLTDMAMFLTSARAARLITEVPIPPRRFGRPR